MWLPLVLIATIVTGITLVFAKQSSKLNGAYRTTIFWFFWHCLMMVIFIAIIRPEFILEFNIKDAINMLPLIIIQTLAFVFAIKALEYAKVSLVTPIQRVSVIVTIMIGVFFLNDQVTIVQLIISALLLGLVIMLGVSANKEKNGNKNLRLGMIYTFLSIPFLGATAALYKPYIDHFGDPLYVIFYTSLIAVIGLVIYLTIKKDWHLMGLSGLAAKWSLIIVVVLDFIAILAHRFSLVTGSVSVVAVITTASLVVTLLVSRIRVEGKIVLGERLTAYQYLLITGVIVCVIILALIKSL